MTKLKLVMPIFKKNQYGEFFTRVIKGRALPQMSYVMYYISYKIF